MNAKWIAGMYNHHRLHGLPKQVQATVSWALTGSGYVTSVMGTQDEKRYDSLDEAKAAAEVQLRTILTNALKAIS